MNRLHVGGVASSARGTRTGRCGCVVHGAGWLTAVAARCACVVLRHFYFLVVALYFFFFCFTFFIFLLQKLFYEQNKIRFVLKFFYIEKKERNGENVKMN